MRKLVRSVLTATGVLTTAGAIAIAGASLPAQADALSAATATPSATATATPSATAAPTSTSSATPSAAASDAPSAAASDAPSAQSSLATDPTLAQQNAAGDHAMGATITANEGTVPATSTFSAEASPMSTPSGTQGLDVSAYQKNIDWSNVWNMGARFAYVKATEGTTYKSAEFAGQYNGAYGVGMIRGAYHYATPNTSSGATQANYFVDNGGGWSADGRTLPPLLDIEYGYSSTCWGLSQSGMVSWIRDFSNTVYSRTGIRPAIYSTTNWWKTCTGNSAAFSDSPLFVAIYPSVDFSGPGTLGASWKTWAIWQWTSTGAFPGDSDVFNASYGTLQSLALGGRTEQPLAVVSTAHTQREQGANAFETSADISRKTYVNPGLPTVYIATRSNYADALSGAPAAGSESGPTLLATRSTLPDATRTELARLKPQRIVILGGTSAIDGGVAGALAAYTSKVVRIAGVNRFDTSAQVSKATFSSGVGTAYVATGTNFPDALAGAAIAAQSGPGKGLGKASNGGPMLLTRADSIPTEITTELARLKPKRIVVLGGTAVVNDAVKAQLQQYTTGSVTRWSGGNRFATAANIATANFATSPTVYLATGTDYADALSGAPMAGWNGFPLLLVTKDSIPDETAAAIRKLGPTKIVILGGDSAVSERVQAAL